MLGWRTVTPSSSPMFLVRGTELSVAIVPGTLSRFQICEVRTLTRSEDGWDYDREYCLRDAHTVSDQDVRDGRRPAIVHRAATLDEALDWAMSRA